VRSEIISVLIEKIVIIFGVVGEDEVPVSPYFYTLKYQHFTKSCGAITSGLKEMREVTRSIHNRSDALVNAKLGITLSDDSVWAEGSIIITYRI
jgi:hypothetical protein